MSQPPDHERAEDAIRDAITIQQGLRMTWELACSLYRRTDKRQEAQEAGLPAIRTYGFTAASC